MLENIIRNDKVKAHNIQPYYFKALSTPLPIVESSVEAPEENNFTSQESSINNIDPIIEESSQETSLAVNEITPNSESKSIQDSDFIEKLLKKTDDLSTENVKLQMQNESLKEEFTKEIEEKTAAALEEGMQKGYEKNQQEVSEFLNSLQTQYQRTAALFESKIKEFDDFISKTQDELSEAAINIAKEVIAKELSENSSKIALSLSQTLLKELNSNTKIEIRANPKDFELLQSTLTNEKIKITSDEAIIQGGVIILSDMGNVDGSIKTRLEQIALLMKE